jgi:hypothetical protein
MKRFGAAAAFVMAAAPAAEAGPWAMGKKHMYFKVSYQYLHSTTLVTPDGTRYDIPLFRKDDAGSYLAYGLTDRLTLTSTIPFLRSSNLADIPNELGRETGIGDLQTSLQVQLGQSGSWVFAARGTVQYPTGDETRAGGLLPTGSGVWEGMAVIGVGRSLAGGIGYGYFELGHQFRGGGLRDGLVYELQLGWNAKSWLVLAGNLRGVEPYTTAPGSRTAGSFVGVGDRVTYAVYGPTAIFKLSRQWGVQLDVEGTFHERNLATGLVLRGGVTFQQ